MLIIPRKTIPGKGPEAGDMETSGRKEDRGETVWVGPAGLCEDLGIYSEFVGGKLVEHLSRDMVISLFPAGLYVNRMFVQ